MHQITASPDQAAQAPQAFRGALAELVQIGLSVARMVGRVAEVEAASAAAGQTAAAEGVSALAGSLAEAIEADRAASAAGQARQMVAARAEAIAAAFARVSRAIRLTILLAERLDRCWAPPRGAADDGRAQAVRPGARPVADAIGREAEGERAERLTEALAQRLEALDRQTDIGDRPAEDIIRAICGDLGLDPVRMMLRPPLPGVAGSAGSAGLAGVVEAGWRRPAPQRLPDG